MRVAQELVLRVDEPHLPDVTAIAERNARDHMEKLLELLLGAALYSARKDEFVARIMSMPESTQHVLMTAIQSTMGRARRPSVVTMPAAGAGGGHDPAESAQSARGRLQLEAECAALRDELAAVQARLLAITRERDRLQASGTGAAGAATSADSIGTDADPDALLGGAAMGAAAAAAGTSAGAAGRAPSTLAAGGSTAPAGLKMENEVMV